MKKAAVLIVAVAVVATGCTTMTRHHREISIRKDANGNVVETVETEWVEQTRQEKPMTIRHVKE